ncbi:hypothetical protein PMKS-002748 [Pichia membranifaciens]|uniref:Autophagy-related protein 13 n=1 Tax=Pichia membranifaciens TaxID=4926 RepID=A0A1Q2YI90_9ASCO|nr:hypothetical protein PMKS-002748 [Pichia membranifaciens]
MLPPMIVETVLDLSELSEHQKLFVDNDMINTKKKSEIVLERWLIKLDLENYDNDSMELPIIYKKTIVMFRCLYTLTRLLPASKLVDNDSEKLQSRKHLDFKVKTKILNGSKALTSKGRFGLSRPLVPDKPDMDVVESKDLLPVLTPIGSLCLSVSYRKNCNFRIQDTRDKDEVFQPENAEDPVYQANFSHTNNINTDMNRTANTSAKDSSTTANVNIDYQSTSPIGNLKFRASSTSINSQSSRRRMSTRSVSIFKTGSMASSSPPNTNLLHNNSVSPNHVMNSSFANSNPIPVKRVDSTSSVHFYNNSAERNENNTNPNVALITSTSSKFPSSFGSKFRSGSSRNNSLEGHLTVGNNNFAPSSNPILQNFKSKNKFFTSSFSDMDPNNSLYLDDDLNNFMKLLDSKPDLRISNNSSVIFEDSLSNFKSLRKHNDLFSDSPLKESLAFSRSASSSPSKPPPLITYNDQTTLDSTVKLLLDNKQNFESDNKSNSYISSAPINFPRSHTTFPHSNTNVSNSSNNMTFGSLDRNIGYENSFSRARAESKGSRDSRDSHGSRGSRGSTGILHGQLVTSASYSPHSPLGTSSQVASHSIHSILKASATSGTSGAVATGINTAMESNNDPNKQLSDSSYDRIGVNREKMERISPSPTSSLPRNLTMNRAGSAGGRAHSLLRSLSVSSGVNSGPIPGSYYAYQPRSRTGSSGSITGSHLRNVLHSSLRNEGYKSRQSNKDGNITPEQLKDMSYGQRVFESEDEADDNEEAENGENLKSKSSSESGVSGERDSAFVLHSSDEVKSVERTGNSDSANNRVNNKGNEATTMQRGSRGSLNNILTNMKNMQRRQSSGRSYNQLRLSGGAGPVTLHPDDVGYEHGEEDDEDDEDEDDDLLFEMSDMTAIK